MTENPATENPATENPAPATENPAPATGSPAPATAGTRRGLAVKRIRPAYEQVADQLRELVVSGKIAPGDRLPVEGVLSAEFGVSRSTVREAIRLLSSQSLVHTVRGPAGGTFVAQADPETLREYLHTSIGLLSGGQGISVEELLEVRDALEVPAARLAALRRTDVQLAAMREGIAREREQDSRSQRFEQNQQFHAQVLVAAGNKLLAVVTDPVYSVIQSRFLQDVPRPLYAKVTQEHAEILECIERQDGSGAAARMAAHLDGLRDVYGRQPAVAKALGR